MTRLRSSVHAAATRLGRRLGERPKRSASRDAPSALVIPVPAGAQATAGWSGDARRLIAQGMPYHVTVLYPFVAADAIDDEVESALAVIATGCAGFEFELTAVRRFPEVLFIAPEPAEPFVALTHAVHERWPEHPPYRGEFEDVVPHLTIASGPEPAGLAGAVEAKLPIPAAAVELWLLTEEPDRSWAVRNRFALGREASAEGFD